MVRLQIRARRVLLSGRAGPLMGRILDRLPRPGAFDPGGTGGRDVRIPFPARRRGVQISVRELGPRARGDRAHSGVGVTRRSRRRLAGTKDGSAKEHDLSMIEAGVSPFLARRWVFTASPTWPKFGDSVWRRHLPRVRKCSAAETLSRVIAMMRKRR